MITADDIITSGGKYPERANFATDDVRESVKALAAVATQLLASFGASRKITSGFRDADSNKRVGGATHSAHIEGKAVDLTDPDGRLAIFCLRNQALLANLGLWLEDPQHTRGWVHLQTRPVAARVFRP